MGGFGRGVERRCFERRGGGIWRLRREDLRDGLDAEHSADRAQDFASLRHLCDEGGDFWIGQELLQLVRVDSGFGQILPEPSEAARERDI